MSQYSIVYLIFAIIMLLYTIRHRLDLLCIATVCYLVYTVYCIPGIGVSGFYRPKLSSTLYLYIYVQMIIVFVFIIISRRRYLKRNNTILSDIVKKDENKKDIALRYSFRIYTLVISLFAFVNIFSVGIHGFRAGKAVVWEQTNVLYVVSLYGAYPSFAYGIHKNDKLIWIPSLLIELSIFFAGARAFATTLIVIFLCEKGTLLWKKRKQYTKVLVLGALGIVFLLLYRMVDTQIMEGDISGAIQTLKNPQTWAAAFEFNEPRVIIANYDYVFTSGIRLPVVDSVYRLIDFIPGATKVINLQIKYPEYFSDWLQEQVHGSAGVAGSIWGESYAMFGGTGIIISTIVWLLFIRTCCKHLDYHDGHSYFLVSIGAYLAWYINRLDYNRVAQSCKIMLLCFLIWIVPYLILGGKLQIGKNQIKIRSRENLRL